MLLAGVQNLCEASSKGPDFATKVGRLWTPLPTTF
jgi:hypothetical protein